MQFRNDLEQLRLAGVAHGGLRDDDAAWPEFAELTRRVAAQIPGVDAGALVEAMKHELPRTRLESMMPLDRLAVGRIYEAAMDSKADDARPYEEAAADVYRAVKHSISPQR